MIAAACGTTAGDPAPRARRGDVAALDASPRHHEWVDVRRGDRTVRCFVVYPEAPRPVPAVVVLHENKGLTDWVRTVADRLGGAGFLAIAPDLLSGTAPAGGGTEQFASESAATTALYALPPDQVTADLHAVADRVRGDPACDGTVSVAGFCWGGAQTFRFATSRADLADAYVFYGTAPDDEAALARITCPVHGFYGENDARVNATLPATEERMRRAGKSFEATVYPGAGHAFLRSGAQDGADPANRAAADASWARLLELLRRR